MTVPVEDLAKAIAAATDEITYRDRVRENPRGNPCSALNPTGAPKPHLTRDSFFAGAQQDEDAMTAREIELFNQLTPGLYLDGKIEVEEKKYGTKNLLNVSFPLGPDCLADLPRSLAGLLGECIAEAAKARA